MQRIMFWLLSCFLAWHFSACDKGDSKPPEDTGITEDILGTEDASEVSGEVVPEVPLPVEPHVEKVDQYTIVYLAGTPYEMGVQQGELLHDIIADAVAFVQADLTLSAIPLIAKDMGIIDIAKENSYPDLLDECQGLVDATADVGFTMDLCLVLNFGDVMLEMVSMGVPEAAHFEGPGCSGVVVAGAATPDGRMRHARNLDWGSMNIDIIHQHPVIFVRQPEDGIPHVYIGFPLNLSPYTGMNMAGIAIGSQEADPASPAEMATTGRSHAQMVAELLKSTSSMGEVRDFILQQKHMSTELLVISDGTGQTGSVFEMTATGVGERMLEKGFVYATNHFLHPDMVPRHAPAANGSLGRLLRFTELVDPDGKDSMYGLLDEAGLAAVMRDPVDPSIGNELSAEEMEAANWDIDGALGVNGPMHFVIFDPEKRLFWVDAGILPLHKQPYQCFSLEELLGYPDATPCLPDVIE